MKKYIDFDIKEFQELVKNGVLSDDKGQCVIVYNGKISSEYIVMLNRRIVVSAGRVISYTYFRDNFNLDRMSIRFYPNKLCIRYWEFLVPELFNRIKNI